MKLTFQNDYRKSLVYNMLQNMCITHSTYCPVLCIKHTSQLLFTRTEKVCLILIHCISQQDQQISNCHSDTCEKSWLLSWHNQIYKYNFVKLYSYRSRLRAANRLSVNTAERTNVRRFLNVGTNARNLVEKHVLKYVKKWLKLTLLLLVVTLSKYRASEKKKVSIIYFFIDRLT